MSDVHAVTSRPRVLVMAFQGWSDAGDATTDVLQHLSGLIHGEVIHTIGAEGYVDFQVHRPKVSVDKGGDRVLDWPDTRLVGTVFQPGTPIDSTNETTVRRIDGTPVTDLFLLAGVEPARDWQSYADDVVELIEAWDINLVIILGSMYSDAPHSRAIATTVTTESERLREETGAERSAYSGPVGIGTIIDLALQSAGVETIALWAHVPHYVHSSPSPKATLALLDKLEELLDLVIPRGDLLTQANEWEANINRIASGDEEMTRYIRGLEESRDEALAAESTGNALALEFEKFLEGGSGNHPGETIRGDDSETDIAPDTDTDTSTGGDA